MRANVSRPSGFCSAAAFFSPLSSSFSARRSARAPHDPTINPARHASGNRKNHLFIRSFASIKTQILRYANTVRSAIRIPARPSPAIMPAENSVQGSEAEGRYLSASKRSPPPRKIVKLSWMDR